MRTLKGQLDLVLPKIQITGAVVDGEAQEVGAEGWLGDVVGRLHDRPREQVGSLVVEQKLRGDKC